MMKKKVILIFFLIAVFSLSGVLSYIMIPYVLDNKPKEYYELVEYEAKVKEAKEALKSDKYKEYKNRIAEENKAKNEAYAEAKRLAEEKATLRIGETKEVNGIEFTIKDINFTYDVLPDDTSSAYTHYAASQGQVYLQVITNVKNNNKQLLPCDSIYKASLDYNNGYTYSSFVIPQEEDGQSFSYANIESISPLQTRQLRILYDLPEEIESSDKPIKLSIKVGDENFTYNYR